jgi:hypothetical protein
MRTAGKIFPAADMIAAAVCDIFQPDVDDICDAVQSDVDDAYNAV